MDARVAATINTMRLTLGGKLSILDLSRRVNISPSRLRQLFEKDTGRSPLQYLRELRMQQAEHLLTSTFLSIKEVAFRSGVRHVSSFVHDFKTRHGLTPTEFRTRTGPIRNRSPKTVKPGE